ncbi:unnamed protein product, partial [Owenia fusiformis]
MGRTERTQRLRVVQSRQDITPPRKRIVINNLQNLFQSTSTNNSCYSNTNGCHSNMQGSGNSNKLRTIFIVKCPTSKNKNTCKSVDISSTMTTATATVTSSSHEHVTTNPAADSNKEISYTRKRKANSQGSSQPYKRTLTDSAKTQDH